MSEQTFKSKWAEVLQFSNSKKQNEEFDIFVPPGQKPQTQRQLDLYYYFIFIRDVLQSAKAREVLEIGCGRGTMSLYLTKYLGLNLHLLDDAADAIAVAERLFSKHRVQAKFYVRDAVKTDFPDARFDAVVSIGLAEHLSDVAVLFTEQYRILKPGGVMISLNIPKKFSWQFLNTAMRLCKKITGSYTDSVRRDYYRHALSPAAYAAAARTVGFHKTGVTPVAPFPFFTPLRPATDQHLTSIYRVMLFFRSLWMTYPYRSNSTMSQAHFLVAYKPFL